MGNKITILIADDTLIAREGWKRILEFESDIEVVGEAVYAQEVLARVKEKNPDILLIDLKWFDDETAGAGAIEQVRNEMPSAGIIATTSYRNLFPEARLAGADGTLLKGFSKQDLVGLIRAVYENRSFPSPRHDRTLTEQLTERERQVLDLIAGGKTDKEIAAELGIAFNTARNHVGSVLGKLGASNKAQAVTIGRERGWLSQ